MPLNFASHPLLHYYSLPTGGKQIKTVSMFSSESKLMIQIDAVGCSKQSPTKMTVMSCHVSQQRQKYFLSETKSTPSIFFLFRRILSTRFVISAHLGLGSSLYLGAYKKSNDNFSCLPCNKNMN
jgi:hypothetical protein